MRDSSTQEDPEPAAQASAESTHEIADALRALRRELTAAVREIKVLAGIQVDRARIWARESAWTIGLVLLATVVALVLLVAATIAFARGLCGAFAAWLGAEWAGALAGGSVGLLLVFGVLVYARHRMRAANLRRLRAKYESELGPPAP